MGVMEDNITAANCSWAPVAGVKMTDEQKTSFELQFKHAATFNYIGNLVFRLAVSPHAICRCLWRRDIFSERLLVITAQYRFRVHRAA